MMIDINGAIVEAGPHIDSRDRGFLLGDGLFETILVRRKCPLFLDDHLVRLGLGCNALLVHMPCTAQMIKARIDNLIDANAIDDSDHALRITLSRGVGARGLVFADGEGQTPTLLIALAPLAPRTGGMRFMVSSYRRASQSITSRHKTLSYLDNIIARNEAALDGFDEAIMLNESGTIACGSMSSVFMIDADNRLLTPSLDQGALAGTVRARVIAHARAQGIIVNQEAIAPERLAENFAFATNSLIGLVPLIGPKKLPAPPLFRSLELAYGHDITDALAQR